MVQAGEGSEPSTRAPSAEALRDFIARAFVAVGMPDADAATVAALMTEADLQGSDGHGVIRLAPYLKRIRAGGINLRPEIRIVEERAATALVDGDNAMGHLVMTRAAQIAAEKAQRAGIGWAGTRFSKHAGPAWLDTREPTHATPHWRALAIAISAAFFITRWPMPLSPSSKAMAAFSLTTRMSGFRLSPPARMRRA